MFAFGIRILVKLIRIVERVIFFELTFTTNPNTSPMKRAATFFRGVLIFIFLLVSSQISFSQINSTGLLFDGINDQVYIPGNSIYGVGTGDFTIEMWVKIFSRQKDITYPQLFSNYDPGVGIIIRGNGESFDIVIGNDYFTFSNFTA